MAELGSLIWTTGVQGALHKELAQAKRDIARLQSRRVHVAQLHEMTPDLGLIMAGEFRAGNDSAPDEGFTGMRMGYPGFTYGGLTWHLVGVDNDVLQAGISATDGKLYAGAGAVVIGEDGIAIETGTGDVNSIQWLSDSSGAELASISASDGFGTPDGAGLLIINAVAESGSVQNPFISISAEPDTGTGVQLILAKIGSVWGAYLTAPLLLTEQAAPSTPDSSFGAIYLKTDGKVYAKNDAGTEYDLTIGALVKTNVALTAQTADIGATNLLTTATAGTYRVNYTLLDTTADVTAGTVTVTFGWTDGAGATTQASAALPLAATGRTSGLFHVQLASGNITYTVTHAGIYGTSAYALYIDVERLS